MICLADNDFVLKLAACDLLNETLDVLGLDRSEVYVLPTAKYKIAKDKRLPARYGEGVGRALTFLASVVEISFTPDPDELVLLSEVKDSETGERSIHEGERVLLASTSGLDDFLLATGDKNCLRALSSAPGCAAIRARCGGRVVCLEQTILWLIDANGFEYVRAKAVPARGCDTALRAAFGSGMDATQENVTLALTAYIEELDQETAGLLKRSRQHE